MSTARYSRKIRICILMPYHWSHSMGGAEYQAKCIVDALHKSGHYEIYFLARYIDPTYKPGNHTLIRISNFFGVTKSNYFLDFFSIQKELSTIKPDVIYQRVGSAYTGIGANFVKKRGGKLVWHIARDDDVTPSRLKFSPRFIRNYIEKKFLEYGVYHATNIIAQTNDQANLLEANYARKPTAVIHNFHPLPELVSEKTGAVKIVWIANIKPNKRPELFLSLANELAHIQQVEFIMIGDLQGNNYWGKKLSERISQTPNVNYMGGLPQNQVNQILSSAHLFINTSKLEGFPNTFIQAWMRKVPVISLGINPDGVFTHNKVGLNSSSFEELKSNTLKLITDSELRNVMGNNARQYAMMHHSEKNALELLKIFTA